MVPWWAEVHIMGGFVLFYWIIAPALYYSNVSPIFFSLFGAFRSKTNSFLAFLKVWNFAHFPMMGQSPYDRFGHPYDIDRVLTPIEHTLNVTAYEEYSPLYLTINYSIAYLIAFALTTCILVHTALYHGPVLWNGFKKRKTEEDDIHAKLMKAYPNVPNWWYISVLLVFYVMGLIALTVSRLLVLLCI